MAKELSVTLMVGIPGSGKSYEAQKLIEKGWADVVISSDALRRELLDDETCQTQNEKVFKEYYKRMTDYLKAGKSVVLDATNINIKMRKMAFHHIGACKIDGLKIYAYVVNTPLDRIIEQNEKRERVVPIEVINKYLSMYQHPQKYEGFYKILLKNDICDPDYNEINKIRCMMDEYNQGNKHHIYTLGEHCRRVAENYMVDVDMPFDKIARYYAGLWHDVGKLFTRSYSEDGEAHYYSHGQVGAYYLVSHPELLGMLPRPLFEETIFYVNFHMNAHDWRRSGGSSKYCKLFGEELYDRLMEFSGYDRLACGTTDKID